MKTTEMSATLKAFAELVGADRAEELRKLAGIFSGGKDETVAARVKRILKRLNTGAGSPPTLKKSLTDITGVFVASKAKQATDFQALLLLFAKPNASTSTDAFVNSITEALTPPAPTPAHAARDQPPDLQLAATLTDELKKNVLETEAFSKVLDRLRDTRTVSTPTLGAVANRFLENDKRYSGRKAAIDDISRRQKQDARAHARRKALDNIPV